MSRLELNGRKVEFHPGETLLQLASRHGYAVPTICYHEATGTRGLCRVCAVEVAGQARPVPACATLAQEGMEVRTESDELHTLRRTIYEWTMLATDTSEAPGIEREAALLSTDPARWGRAPQDRLRRVPIRDNPFFLRDYAKCVQCRRCVDACGDGIQGVWALSLAGRSLQSCITTPLELSLPESPCVFCGNCVQVCPTNALKPLAEAALQGGPA